MKQQLYQEIKIKVLHVSHLWKMIFQLFYKFRRISSEILHLMCIIHVTLSPVVGNQSVSMATQFILSVCIIYVHTPGAYVHPPVITKTIHTSDCSLYTVYVWVIGNGSEAVAILNFDRRSPWHINYFARFCTRICFLHMKFYFFKEEWKKGGKVGEREREGKKKTVALCAILCWSCLIH